MYLRMLANTVGVIKSCRSMCTKTIVLCITAEVKEIVEEQMRRDDETTAMQLHQLLVEKGYLIFRRSIRGSALIRHANLEMVLCQLIQ